MHKTSGFALVAVLFFLLVSSAIITLFSIATLTRSMILANEAQKAELGRCHVVCSLTVEG